jgi:hypothetical protein
MSCMMGEQNSQSQFASVVVKKQRRVSRDLASGADGEFSLTKEIHIMLSYEATPV